VVIPSVTSLWKSLEQVTDPEIPVISIVELGIVRNLDIDADSNCVVTITPTYSGCPAMEVIAEEITTALQNLGVKKVKIVHQLSPAWTTDWMHASGKAKLREYGIAPPVQQVIDISSLSRISETHIDCTHCGSKNTRLLSQFGSTSCKALYRCNDCLEPFDYFKAH
jgi:ring-1,2-phenylacetyl-CoA epoxidase subunit PaaD